MIAAVDKFKIWLQKSKLRALVQGELCAEKLSGDKAYFSSLLVTD